MTNVGVRKRGGQGDERWYNAEPELSVMMCSFMRDKNETIWALGRFGEQPVNGEPYDGNVFKRLLKR